MAFFPASVIDYLQSGVHKTSNLGNSTLTTAITSGSTTFTVTSATNVTPWPTTIFTVLIGTELIFCASRSGNVCTITQRGFGGTTQADHAISDVVLVVLASQSIDAAYQEIIAIENVLKGITPGDISITGNIAVSGTVDGRDVATDGTKLDGIEATAQNNTVTNVGTGAGGVYKQKVGSQIQLKTIKAGTNVTVTNNTDDITIAATDTGEVNTASNSASGTGTGTIFKTKSGVDLVFKKLKAGTGVTLTNQADDIQIDATGAGGGEVNTASNLGTGADGEGLFTTKNGVDLPFKRIKAGSNISLTPTANSVEIAVTGAGAPNDAQYLTLAGHANLTSERVFAVGNGITATDAGANNTYTIVADPGDGITVTAAGINLASTAAGNGLTYTTGVLDIVPTSGSNLVANANDLDWTGLSIQKSGTAVATRPIVNFIEGTNVTITATENAGSDRIDVTINSAAASGFAPVGATYIVQTADGTLTNEQALGALATGMLKNTTTTGVLSIGVAGTDYAKPDTASTWSANQTFNAGRLLASNIVNGAATLTLPAVTDTLVARTTTDTLTNKTLGNTNIITLREDRFTLQDATDNTKQAIFELGSIATATTRTYTLPNASTTVVGTDATQTLTNKTLSGNTASNFVNTGTVTLPTATTTLVGTGTTDTLTNKTITGTTNTVSAKSLLSATTTVDVFAAAAPSAGQALVATSSTAATWQDVATQTELNSHASATATHGVSGAIVGTTDTQTLTNKTLTSSTNVLGGVTLTLGSDATGDIYYRNSGSLLTRLPVGTTRQVLKVVSGLPAWEEQDKAVTLTDGATPALDASLGNVFLLTAVGDRTIAIPSNPVSGQKIVIAHTASGANRTLALNTGTGGFRFGTDITALTATVSAKTDYIGAIYNSSANKWDVIAYSKGF